MEKKSLIGLGLGAIAGTALAFYTSQKRDVSVSRSKSIPPAPLLPLSELIHRQINCETLHSATLREWFLSATNQKPTGTFLCLSRLDPLTLNALGYQMDQPLDQEHYLFAKITEARSGGTVAATLFNFCNLDPSLEQLLEQGNGVIKITGTPQEDPSFHT